MGIQEALRPSYPLYTQKEIQKMSEERARRSRRRFEEAARQVRSLMGTTEEQCAAITFAVLLGPPILRQAKSSRLISSGLFPGCDIRHFKNFLLEQTTNRGWRKLAPENPETFAVLLISEQCVGGLALWRGNRAHASPILPGPFTDKGLDIYYLGREGKWPPYTRANLYGFWEYCRLTEATVEIIMKS